MAQYGAIFKNIVPSIFQESYLWFRDGKEAGYDEDILPKIANYLDNKELSIDVVAPRLNVFAAFTSILHSTLKQQLSDRADDYFNNLGENIKVINIKTVPKPESETFDWAFSTDFIITGTSPEQVNCCVTYEYMSSYGSKISLQVKTIGSNQHKEYVGVIYGASELNTLLEKTGGIEYKDVYETISKTFNKEDNKLNNSLKHIFDIIDMLNKDNVSLNESITLNKHGFFSRLFNRNKGA